MYFTSHASGLPLPPMPWRSYVGAAILGGGIGYTLAHLFKVNPQILFNYLPNECKILSHLSLEMEYWLGLSIKYNYKSPLLRSRILTMSSVQGFFSLALHFFIFRNNFAII